MIYTAKHLLPITSEPIRNGGVLVRGDRIEAVGADLASQYPEEPVTDLGDAILLPGFVNTHSHLDYTILRGAIDDLPLFPWVRRITEYALKMQTADFRWSSLLGAAELIQAGVTTTADASYSGQPMDALLQSGLRGVVYQEVFGYRSDDHELEMEILRNQLTALREKGTDRVRVGVSPHSIYTVSPGLLQSVRDLARQEQLPLVIHVAESVSEYEFCVGGVGEIARLYESLGVTWTCPGVSPLQYLYDLGLLGERTLAAHCVYVDEDDVRLLAVSRSGVAHCPRSNAKLGVGVAPVAAMLNAGVRLGLGTDSAVSNNSLNIRDEIGSSVLLQRADRGNPPLVDAERMVAAATIGGARALGLDSEVGSLEPGKKADLTAIDVSAAGCFPDRDPYSLLAYSGSGQDVILTMVDGVVLFVDKELRTLDLAEIKQNARRTVTDLFQEDVSG